jgi:hypothetical protein
MPPRVAIILLLLGAGCASQPAPRPVALDPSNPAAQEAPSPKLTPLVARSTAPAAPAAPEAPKKEAEPAHDHTGDDTKAKAKVTYVCPMHPEITSPEPGKCPKCGMKLVPKEPPAPSGERK